MAALAAVAAGEMADKKEQREDEARAAQIQVKIQLVGVYINTMKTTFPFFHYHFSILGRLYCSS